MAITAKGKAFPAYSITIVGMHQIYRHMTQKQDADGMLRALRQFYSGPNWVLLEPFPV